MKFTKPLIIAFFLGALWASGSLARAIYGLLVLVGMVVLVVLGMVCLYYLDQAKSKDGNQQAARDAERRSR